MAKIGKTAIRFHWSWWAITIGFVCLGAFKGGIKAGLLYSITWLIILIVILGHELSHSFVAKFFGYQTKLISFHMFGGTAFIETKSMSPKEDMAISLAGPFFNLALAVFCIILFPVWHNSMFEKFIADFAFFSLLVGVFNLLPIYPMDGGRALRALIRTLSSNNT